MEQKLNDAAKRLPQADLPFDAIEERMPKKKGHLPRLLMLAACLALVLGLGFGSYTYVAEAQEYERAIHFFEEYSLSTQGLSREDIKAVYRDITTRAFTYDKTAQVLQSSLSAQQVPGFEIAQEAPTAEDVEKLWDYAIDIYARGEIRYECHWDYIEKTEGDRVYDKLEQSQIHKYRGNTLLWTAEITDFRVDSHKSVSDGLIVYGQTDDWYGKDYAMMAKLDDRGNILWQRLLSNGFEDEYIAAVVENEDGSYAVFSRGDFKYLCCGQYTAQGEPVSFQKNQIGNYGIRTAARLGEDYIVLLFSYNTNEHAKILKVDKEGTLTEEFSYSSDDAYYYITDMIDFDGRIYLSAYSVPRLEDEEDNAGGRYEVAGILDKIDHWEISSQELTPIVREHYTAMLLICDPNGGEPREFYSVEGSIGSSLLLTEEGSLQWDVESIIDTEYSPMTSAFSIRGSCQVFAYCFDTQGQLISQEKTDRVNWFWR